MTLAVDTEFAAALLETLVRRPSQQTDRMEAEPEVQSFIGDVVAPLFAARGLVGRRDGMGSLIVEIGPAGAKPGLLVMAYAMTHPAAAMANPFAGERIALPEGYAIRGRGVSEQKGALAAAIAAIDAVRAALPWRRRLVFALSSAGETGRHDAARCILDSLAEIPPLGILALGTNNRIALGNKGRIDIEIEIEGRSAHSSTPWAGIDAIAGACRVVEGLAALPLGNATHPSLGAASLTPTAIESFPKATHTIQSRVRLTFDRRLLPGENADAAFAAIADAASRAVPPPAKAVIRRGPHMLPSEIAADGAFMRAVAAGHARASLPPPQTMYSHAALDAGYLGARGCEAAMWGPGRVEQFHSENEALLIDELMFGARAYAGMMQACLT